MSDVSITHLCLGSLKGTLADIVDPDQMPQNTASDQSTRFALNAGILIKHGNYKNNQILLLL